MSETWQQPAYVGLARRSAAILGAPHDAIVRAILAQWQCEQPSPAPWPPIHNNPGNLTRHIGALGGPPPPVATTSPGIGLLYVYPTPVAGGDAYSHYLLASSHYGAAIAAARRGDATGFLELIAAGGYGTRASCMLGLLPHVTLPPPPPTTPRWRCEARTVNVRRSPHTSAPIVGQVHGGDLVSGPLVVGGAYQANGRTFYDWVELSAQRFTAAAFYRRIP